MTTIKIYGVGCEGDNLAARLDVAVPPIEECALVGPKDWRSRSLMSQEARRLATREGWKRVKYQAKYGTVMCDVCPGCYPALESALKAVQS